MNFILQAYHQKNGAQSYLNYCLSIAKVCLILLVSACSSTPAYQAADIEGRSIGNQSQRGKADSQATYQTGHQAEQLLSNAEQAIRSGNYSAATESLNQLNKTNQSLNSQQSARTVIIQAYLDYSQGQYARALDSLAAISTDPNPIQQRVDALLLSSFCYQSLNQYQTALSVLAQRESLLNGNHKTENNLYARQIASQLSEQQRLAILQLTSNTKVQEYLRSSNHSVGANKLLPTQFQPSLNSFQIINTQWNSHSPKKIAVLLPLSSKYQAASRALLDGINTYHINNNSPFQPTVDVYDISDNPLLIDAYYQAAVKTQADFIIGPLGADYAKYLSNNSDISVPTLSLSGNSPINKPKLTRLSLTPEQEGIAVAQYALSQGFRTGALFKPNTKTGERSASSFTDYYQRHGGVIVKTTQYSSQQYDHSVEVKQLLNINESKHRHTLISNTLGYRPKFIAQRRQDIDFVFMLANNKSGRLLRPQINFFGGYDLTVLASSDIYNGVEDIANDMDLDNTLFPVMPWVLDSNSAKPYGGQLGKLYAMGVDAYQLASNLMTLRANPSFAMNGRTGLLHIDNAGQVIAQPIWARFIKGKVSPINQVSPTQNTQHGSDYDNNNDNGQTSRSPSP